tara:strand:+ start:207 stop:431 length:225 start_codon:yes stop_codon:yes gene_type:complete
VLNKGIKIVAGRQLKRGRERGVRRGEGEREREIARETAAVVGAGTLPNGNWLQTSPNFICDVAEIFFTSGAFYS